MGRPLRAKYANTTYTEGVIEMSDSDLDDLCAPLILSYVVANPSTSYGTSVRINSAGTYDVSRGSATDTRSSFIGDHPASNTTVSTYTVYQNENAIALSPIARPVMYVQVGSEHQVKEMSNQDILDYFVPSIVGTMIAGGQGGYYLGPTVSGSPGGGTWVSYGTMNDTYWNSSNTFTTDEYTLWQKTSSSTPGTIRPLKINSGGTLIEMSNTEIESIAQYVGEYIRTTGIGQYAFQGSAPGSGTWTSRGSFVDKKNNLSDQSYGGTYTGAFTSAFTGQYSGAYTGEFTGAYTGAYSLAYTGEFTGAYSQAFTGIYTGAYSQSYAGAYTATYTSPYTGAYTQTYISLYTGNYTGVYAVPFGGGQYTGYYAGTYSGGYNTAYTGAYGAQGYSGLAFVGLYATAYTGTYSPGYFTAFFGGSYTSSYTGIYAGSAYTGSYVGNYTGVYAVPFGGGQYTGYYAGTYSGSYTPTYTGVYSSAYTSTYTGAFTGAFTGSFTGAYSSAYTSAYTGSYLGAYNQAFTGQYAGAYSGAFSKNFTGAYSGLTVQTTTSSGTTTLWVRTA